MPTIIPLSTEEEQPITYRFALIASVNIGTRMDNSSLNGSAEIGSGQGTVATYVVISEILDGAR
jgi:hypothetical protein